MLNQPTSSPMMKTMFGAFPGAFGADLAPAASPPAWARSTVRGGPSGQQPGVPMPRPGAPAAAPACRGAGVAPSARAAGRVSLVAARKPSIVPSPTQANA